MQTQNIQVKEAFRAMDPHVAQDVRDSYYRAMEGLIGLQQALAKAEGLPDAFKGGEQQLAAAAAKIMHKSHLGAYL